MNEAKEAKEKDNNKFLTMPEWEKYLLAVKTERELEKVAWKFVEEVGQCTGYRADFGFAHVVLSDFNFGDKIILSCLKTDEILKDIQSEISDLNSDDHYIRSVNLDWALEGILLTTAFLKAIMLVSKDIRGNN